MIAPFISENKANQVLRQPKSVLWYYCIMRMILTEQQMLAKLNAMTQTQSQKQVAKDLGVSPAFLCDVLKGRRDVTARLASNMGFKRIVRFEPKIPAKH